MPKFGTDSIHRREVLGLLAGSTAAGLAGCLGDDDGEGEHGERVPTITLEFWTGLGVFTSYWERAGPIVSDNFEAIGVDAEVTSGDYVAASTALVQDEREMHITLGGLSSAPERLDPEIMSRWMVIDWAGNGDGLPNILNYASCEYSVPALKQARTFDLEERQELVDESQSVMSHDAVLVPTTPTDAPGAYRTDTVEPADFGPGGVQELNPWAYIYSEPTQDDLLVVTITALIVELRNYLHSPSPRPPVIWGTLVYSSLFEYDGEYELRNVLAESWDAEESDDGVVLTVNLRDANFNNGDPITAEDVAFTFRYAFEGAREGHFPQGLTPPYKLDDDGLARIEAVDDTTVEFHLEEPFPPLVTKEMAFWGIVPKERWEEQGAWDNMADFAPAHDVTSGPFEILDWEPGDHLHLGPSDQTHPVHNPGHELFLRGVNSLEAAGEAIKAGDIDIAAELPMGVLVDLDEDYSDVTEGVLRKGFLPFALYNQFPQAPTKFLEFRQAIAQALDRRQINQIAMRGFSTEWMDTGMFGEAHPWRPDDEHLWFPTDDPSGDVDAARATLEEAGWTWDSDDRLRYPQDADLTPRWPAGEKPDPEEFDCLTSDYEVIID